MRDVETAEEKKGQAKDELGVSVAGTPEDGQNVTLSH